jgi:hypothetical protein
MATVRGDTPLVGRRPPCAAIRRSFDDDRAACARQGSLHGMAVGVGTVGWLKIYYVLSSTQRVV